VVEKQEQVEKCKGVGRKAAVVARFKRSASEQDEGGVYGHGKKTKSMWPREKKKNDHVAQDLVLRKTA